MIELLDLTKWKKQKDIILELHREYGINITSRGWRTQVEKWNKRFTNHEVDYYIAHSNSKGFKATRNYQEALISINDYKKRAFNMLKKASESSKAFGVKDNFKFDFETEEIK